MTIIDPTKFHVSTTTPPIWEKEESFQEIMAEQLRHAPWLMLSIVLHGIAAVIFLMMPNPQKEEAKQIVQIAPQNEVKEIVEEKPPEPEPEPEKVEEPVIQENEVTETEVTEAQDFTDTVSDTKESAFDSNQWNSAVGLGGGAGGKYGGRRGGRGGGKIGKSTAVGIERALEWLKKHQDEDGHWDADEFMKHDIEGAPCDGPGNPVHDVGLTGLALLAFLGDGSTMRSGPYKEVVKKGVMWLREQQDEKTGLFGTTNSNEFIYNHAIAALAMVEAYGLSDYKLLKKNAQKGIDYLEYHRNPYLVWRYQPRDGDNDTSVTGWALMAYSSAQFFKLDVNAAALDLCRTWFDQMTDPVSSRTGYSERGGWSSRRTGEHSTRYPREKGECMTAVSLLCRIFLGDDPKKDKMMRAQADLILKKPPVWNAADGSVDHYYWYYATYALYQMGENWWKTWEKHLNDAVVKTQRQDGNYLGSWDPICVWGEDGGRVYSTALLCLTLEAYYRYSRIVH
ncbi:MAG: terpene cyclase/mutase family protein [Planctomycetes bacterium]|nr:terpene cyclase/mutase family protein [Planctomycetota bacterium]